MKENDLFEIMGDIDDVKIEEAYNAKAKNKNFVLLKHLSFAACFILVAAVSFSVINEKKIKNYSVTDTIVEEPKEVSQETVNTPPSQKEKPEANDTDALPESGISSDTDALPESGISNDTDALPESGISSDTSVLPEPESSNDTSVLPEPESSNDVSILPETETNNSSGVLPNNEPNNGAIVIPDVDKQKTDNEEVELESFPTEDDAIVEETAREETNDRTSGGGGGSGGGSSGGGSSASYGKTFSAEYLNSLNEKILEQATNEEFSFIVSSSVNEGANKVEVFVSSMEEALIGKIKALDTQGGAIEFILINIDLQ